jgi:hypothetical protein
MARRYLVNWRYICCDLDAWQFDVHYNGDIMCCFRTQKWCELHIRYHYENSDWSGRYSSITTDSPSRFHSKEINSEEELEYDAYLAHFVSINREEDLERIWSMLHSRHETEGPQGRRLVCGHPKGCKKGQISSHVNQTARHGQVARVAKLLIP